MRCPRWFYAPLAVIAGAAAFAACGELSGLPRASVFNTVDTVTLFALDGTPIATPSAYYLAAATPVRTDQTAALDFAFNIDAAGQPVLLSTGALGLGQGSGLRVVTTAFDSLKSAPEGAYELAQPVAVSGGTVLAIHSRLTNCLFGASVYYYAKMEVLTIDASARSIRFRILVDTNCGYRGLEPGLPQH